MFYDIWADRQAPTLHRLGIKQFSSANTGKISIYKINLHFTLKCLVAPVSGMLEDQHPQDYVGRSTAATSTTTQGMPLRQRIIHNGEEVLVCKNLIRMWYEHERFVKITCFLYYPMSALAQVSAALLTQVTHEAAICGTELALARMTDMCRNHILNIVRPADQ